MIWNNENIDIDIKVKHAANRVLFCNVVNDRQLDESTLKKKFLINEIVSNNPNIINKTNGIVGRVTLAT